MGVLFFKGIDAATIILVVFYIISAVIFYKCIKSGSLNLKYKIGIILFVGFIARLLWIANIDTVPASDFETLFESAKALSNGNNEIFTGNGYLARFPHLSYMVFYLSKFMIFENPLVIIKLVNIVLSILSIFFIYKIVFEVFNKRHIALIALSLAAVFPPMVTYSGVLATENIAIPFYLMSVYAFIVFVKKDMKIQLVLLTGILLGVGNLFRMVGTVMLLAYVIYIIVFTTNSWKKKSISLIALISGFFIILCLGNLFLKVNNITEVNLWKGKEPAITNVLKGSNLKSFGRYNEEDAAIPEMYNMDYDKIKEVSMEIIKDRLLGSNPLELSVFYGVKTIGQWSQGDMSGISWSENGSNDIKYIISEKGKVVFQLVHIGILFLCIYGLFNKSRREEQGSFINLFYLILCGYGSFYLISEMQGRYAYIVGWIFIILAMYGVDKILIKYKKGIL
ncbi:MAG: glycosyltransferase family 39 protein [Clostridium sp.]